MIDKSKREEILKNRPSTVWAGEVHLGSWYTEEEIEAAVKAIRDSMDWNKGFTGEEIEEFEEKFSKYVGTKYAVAINSAQTGLDIAMMCLDLKPGDEVICPAINFPGDHLCIIGQRGKVVFCEVDPRTLQADPADVMRRITPKTRAILITHMNGLSAPMDELLEIAERHSTSSRQIKVIGDAARACGGEYKGTKIGKKGWMTIFSFHTMKLMTTLGEGGMITTDDPEVAERARRYRSFGNGESWGTNYKMTKVQAAVGLVQLRRLDEMIALRRKRAQERTELLKDIPELTLPYEPPGYKHTYYLYNILVPNDWTYKGGMSRSRESVNEPTLSKRDRLMKILSDEYKVGTVVANPPTYTYNKFIREHTQGQRLPISEGIGARLFCPSLHPLMTEEQNEYVAAAIIETVERLRKED
ncbi:MAG: DegT/DnrJ/EryC1/StrS family aminotransferase [Thermoproteota archaeon]